MKLTTSMNVEHLVALLLQPGIQSAITSYKSSAPDYNGEGVAGYVHVNVEFEIQCLEKFTKLYMQFRNRETYVAVGKIRSDLKIK